MNAGQALRALDAAIDRAYSEPRDDRRIDRRLWQAEARYPLPDDLIRDLVDGGFVWERPRGVFHLLPRGREFLDGSTRFRCV